MKFLTATGVGEVKGVQVLARECYIQELKPTKMVVHMVELMANREDVLPNHPESL